VAEKTHPAVGRGTAEAAPTAPHAWPRLAGAPETGPERFWTRRRRALQWAALAISLVVHYAVLPGSLLPQHDFEFHDVDGTLTIPVDLLNEGPAPPLAPPPPPPPEPKALPPTEPHNPEGTLERHRDAGASPRLDAGELDATAHDKDATVSDARADSEPSFLEEGGIAVSEDASASSGSARDAVGMIGAAGNVQAGPQNVVLLVNPAVIRTHPASKRLGLLISAVPQWDDFLVGTGVDPLRDIDWISINGPALLHTEKDVIMVHYSVADAVVDNAIGVLAKKSARGGLTNIGVPGVRAVRGYADRAERIFLRPQPHVLAIVPASYAKTAALILSKASVPAVLPRPAEAMRLTLVHPHGPMPGIPESVTEIRLWIVPRNDDGGADIYGEGVTANASACQSAASDLARLIQDQNSIGVQLLTHGLLNHVEVQPDGSTVRLHLTMTRDQIEIILAFIGGRLGVPMEPELADAGGLGRPTP
jgi:hypothetical protein